MNPITIALQELVKGYGIPPHKINNGYCADVTTVIWEQFPDVHTCGDDELGRHDYSHSIIEFDGLYFDAECPEGTPDWRDLPIYQRQLADKTCRKLPVYGCLYSVQKRYGRFWKTIRITRDYDEALQEKKQLRGVVRIETPTEFEAIHYVIVQRQVIECKL